MLALYKMRSEVARRPRPDQRRSVWTEFTLETGYAAEERVDREVGYRLGRVLGVATIDQVGALLSRPQLAAPDQAVDIVAA